MNSYLLYDISQETRSTANPKRINKNFQKLSNKEICFIFQSVSTNYNKFFKSISWSNFLERHHILIREIWGKVFAD